MHAQNILFENFHVAENVLNRYKMYPKPRVPDPRHIYAD